MTPKSIFVAGRAPVFRTGVAHLLQEHYPQADIRQLDLWGELLRLLSNWPSPPLLVLDLSVSDVSDLVKTRQLAKRSILASTLVIRRETDCPVVKQWFSIGVGAYLSVHVQPEELLTAISEVHAGRRFLDPKIQQKLSLESLQLREQDLSARLTKREQQVLSLIIAERTTREIASDLYISPCTAETHRLNIIRKLGVKNTAGIVREAFRHGLSN